jgi:hypothetical protein
MTAKALEKLQLIEIALQDLVLIMITVASPKVKVERK